VAMTQVNIPKFPNFQYSSMMVNNSNTLYTITQWLNISPPPCILEINAPFTLWTKPQLTRISSVQAIDSNNKPQTFDIIGSGAQLDSVWLFNGMTPTGYYNNDGLVEGSISKVVKWNFIRSSSTVFSLPEECFPRSNTDGKKKRNVQFGPTFPVHFTMYINGFIIDSQFTEKVFFYDGMNKFVRLDFNGFTILQRGEDVYRFSILPELNPYPCEYYYTPAPVWVPPQFEDFLLNVTFQGTMASVWQAFDHYVPTQYQYWYFDQTLTPVYVIDSTMVGGRVSYFDTRMPPAGVFDIPNFCFTL